MANNKYTKDDLYKATATVKRTLKGQINKGKRIKITKNEVFDMIYPKLGLSSRRSLWKSPHIDYLSDWYKQLKEEIESLKQKFEGYEDIYSEEKVKDVEDLTKILKHKEQYISLLEKRIKKLSSENEELRIAYIGKYTKIDSKKGTEFPF